MARHDLMQQRRAQHGPGAGSGLVKEARQRDQPVAGHRPIGGFHADGSGDSSGLTDRTTGIGPDRQRRLERRQGRR